VKTELRLWSLLAMKVYMRRCLIESIVICNHCLLARLLWGNHRFGILDWTMTMLLTLPLGASFLEQVLEGGGRRRSNVASIA
jgi:hypothetical protein